MWPGTEGSCVRCWRGCRGVSVLDFAGQAKYLLCTTKEVHVSESTFTIRVDDQLKEAFAKAAKVSDRTGAQLIREFMREYVQSAREKAEYEQWFKSRVEAGLQDIQEGRVFSQIEIKSRAHARRERLLGAAGK